MEKLLLISIFLAFFGLFGYKYFQLSGKTEQSNFSFGWGNIRLTGFKDISLKNTDGEIESVSENKILLGKRISLFYLSYERYLFDVFGMTGIGGRIGYFRGVGNALKAEGNHFIETDYEIKINFYPIYIYLTYKLDIIETLYSYLVPFFDIGFQNIIFDGVREDEDYQGSRGGLLWAAGALLNIGLIDINSSSSLARSYGISGSYLSIAYTNFTNNLNLSSVDDTQKEFDLSYNAIRVSFLFSFD